MKKYTLKEKVEYNRKRGDAFGTAYVNGVTLYTEYPKCDRQMQRDIKKLIASSVPLARDGHEISKGFLCGVRDAANERRKGKK